MIQDIRTQNKKLLEIDEIADVRRNLKGKVDIILNKFNSSSIDIDMTEENPNRLLSIIEYIRKWKKLV